MDAAGIQKPPLKQKTKLIRFCFSGLLVMKCSSRYTGCCPKSKNYFLTLGLGGGRSRLEMPEMRRSELKARIQRISDMLNPAFQLLLGLADLSQNIFHQALCVGGNRQRGVGHSGCPRHQGTVHYEQTRLSENFSGIHVGGFAHHATTQRVPECGAAHR